jgi:hypothetical protein
MPAFLPSLPEPAPNYPFILFSFTYSDSLDPIDNFPTHIKGFSQGARRYKPSGPQTAPGR